MRRFYNWLNTKLHQSQHGQITSAKEQQKIRISDMLGTQPSPMIGEKSRRFNVSPMTFNVYSANGGWAIEYNHYDHKNDTAINRLHVVPHDADLAAALEKIINYEMLMK